MKQVLDAEQAANYLGISQEDLMKSFYKGLPPGNMGFKVEHSGPLLWKLSDLVPPPKRPQPNMTTTSLDTMAERNECSKCGFKARSKGGLTTHKRKHRN